MNCWKLGILVSTVSLLTDVFADMHEPCRLFCVYFKVNDSCKIKILGIIHPPAVPNCGFFYMKQSKRTKVSMIGFEEDKYFHGFIKLLDITCTTHFISKGNFWECRDVSSLMVGAILLTYQIECINRWSLITYINIGFWY